MSTSEMEVVLSSTVPAGKLNGFAMTAAGVNIMARNSPYADGEIPFHTVRSTSRRVNWPPVWAGVGLMIHGEIIV